MSDVMDDVKKIEIIGTIKDGIAIGSKNIGPILVNILLWILTCWIPYLNVGTTIGMFIGIITKAARNEPIPMTEIFDRKYRKYMGEYFLTSGLVGVGVAVGYIFFIVPGIIISIGWMFAPFLAIDKGKNPSEAITISNQVTYGNKGRIFGVLFLISLVFSVLCSILAIIPVIGPVLAFLGILFLMFVVVGIQSSLYKQLVDAVY